MRPGYLGFRQTVAINQHKLPMSQNVNFISEGVLTPATRFRITPVEQELAKRGWKTHSIHGFGRLDACVRPNFLLKGYRAACRIQRAIRTATFRPRGPVIVQRLAIPIASFPEVRLATRNTGLIIDFDDALFLGSNREESPARRRAFNEAFLAADHVVAGNAWLAENVPAQCKVSIIPTCIDTDKYLPSKTRRSDGKIVIGWMGTQSNLRYLEPLVEPLNSLRKKLGQRFDFCVCSDNKPADLLSRLNAKFIRWSPETEIETLQSFDIGLMPLADQDWSRGKCSFKLISYMAVGIATVSSPVGMNREVVDESTNGLFAHQDDWETPLASLLTDGDMRLKMGIRARQTAEAKYSLRVAVDAYEHIFIGLI